MATTDLGADPVIGRTIGGRYVVRRLLGKGGMGAVYEGEHLGLGKAVAIKLMLPDDDADGAARFAREARAASKVTHEHVVSVFDVGRDGDRDYIVMDYFPGRDLQRIIEDGPLALDRTRAIIRQVLEGLDAIHAAGIIHRDIKPANILVDDRDFVRIMDFGIAKTVASGDDTVTKAGKVVGTFQYMAPEQLTVGKVDHRADLYAVGLTVVAMLGGDDGLDAAPEDFAIVIKRALSPTPGQRYASARELIDALDGKPTRWEQATAGARPAVKTPLPAAPEDSRSAPTAIDGAAKATPNRGRRPIVIAVAGVVAIGAAVAVVLAQRGDKPTRPAQPAPPARQIAPPLAPPADAPPIDHGSIARAAESAGKLDLAIAEYKEAGGPESLFHLGDLSQRLGRTSEAASYFQQYLAAAPSAADHDVVARRLAGLTAAPKPPARVRTGPLDKQCLCVRDEDAGTHGSVTTVCRQKPAKARCRCLDPERYDLCPIPWQIEEDGQIKKVGQSATGTAWCTNPKRAECTALGDKPDACGLLVSDGQPRGGACTGYPSRDGDGNVTDHQVSGTWECSWCTPGTAYYDGHDGDACSGFWPDDGHAQSGHLRFCKH